MKLAIAQCFTRVGDDPCANIPYLLSLIQQSAAQGAEMVLLPELAICGYSPDDLLFSPAFLARCQQALEQLARKVPLPVLVGYPEHMAGRCFNSAAWLTDGQITTVWRKHFLPRDQVFDEPRYFISGRDHAFGLPGIICLGGRTIGVGICEDFWSPPVAAALKAEGAEMLISLNASPYHQGKLRLRQDIMGARARECGLPLLYANLVGGQDELIFDGGSFALDANGALCVRLPQFQESTMLVDWEGRKLRGTITPELKTEEEIYAALVLGLQSFVRANGFRGVILGLSGGVDSALTMQIATDALGAEAVHAVMLPTRFTSAMSLEDAQALAQRLGVHYEIISIDHIYRTVVEEMGKSLALSPAQDGDVTEENIQARARAVVLMALSNRRGLLLLSTGNKSEIAMGYATLYGDMAGGFAPLKDVWKTDVYRLAHYRNQRDGAIPQRILTRAPTAELRPHQTDQDSLPPYEILDDMMRRHVEEGVERRELIAAGFTPTLVDQALNRLHRSEFKRRQGAIGTRISPRAFGKDWRYPISCHYTKEESS